MKGLILGAGIAPCDVPAPTKTAWKNTLKDTMSCPLCGGVALELICPDNDHRIDDFTFLLRPGKHFF